mmetsp:Transcript_5614/g.22971  ORF Transcript_5614/g.22971 Transcript_5614/m.22971 type:complete len:591 (-) Transcript_5614:781-2553(-)
MFFDQASAAEVRAAADPSDAGSHWRREKLKDLVWRAKCLHVHDRPEFAEAIEQLKALTAQVEHIAHAQSQPTYKTPWWMDGEYDDKRAEEHNDRGVASQKQKKHDAAFDEFTEAIRLAPSRAVYHANRAAVALKLGRDACAASDALNACERDPNHVAAHVRAATAILRVGGADPEESLRLFERALVLDPGNVAASRGKADASAAAGAARAERTAQTERARRGERDPLPPAADWPTRAEAADALLAAEEAARLNPRMEGPITAHVEALVLCGRLDRAATTTAQLDADSADRAYLAAEIAWRRSGLAGVDDALARLKEGLAAVASPPRKIVELGSRLARLKELADRGEADVEDGRFESAERAFTAALQLRDQRRLWGTGSAAGGEPYPNRCRADLLRARALARLDGFGYDREGAEGDEDDDDRCFDPEADLEECVAIDPGDVEAWRILADVSRHGGDVERTFLRLRKAQASAPHDEKIAREVFAAARAVKAEADGGTYEGQSIGVSSAMDRRPGSFYKILGVAADSTAKQIRRGYRRAAGKWHPDKWQHEGGDALARAEAEFRRVSAAYEALGNPSRRRAYDSDPARFEASL